MLPFYYLPKHSALGKQSKELLRALPSHVTPTSKLSVFFPLSVSERTVAQADGAVQSLNELVLARHRLARRAVTVRNERPIPLPFEP